MTAHCIVETTNSIEKFEERRSVLNIKNSARREMLRVKVDGCLIVEGKKCDWLLIDKETNTEIFIELKGADVGEGIKQICASAAALSKKPKNKFGYIVCTRSPISSPAIQKLQKEILKSHALTLRVKTRVHSENIEDLIG
jgi:hypothetical protein